MQIILKENEAGNLCLFDTRSNQFFEGGCVRNAEAGQSLLEMANDIARKSAKKIIELADNFIYTDSGYIEPLLADKYLRLNPDLRKSNSEKIQMKKDKKTELKSGSGKRGRPKKK